MVMLKRRNPTALKIGDYERTKFQDSDEEDVSGLSKGQKRRRLKKHQLKAKGAFIETAKTKHSAKDKKKKVKFHVSDVTAELQRLAKQQEEIEHKKLAKISRASRQAMAASEMRQFDAVLNYQPFQSDPFGALQTHLTNSITAGKQQKFKTINPKDVIVGKKGKLTTKKLSAGVSKRKKNKAVKQ